MYLSIFLCIYLLLFLNNCFIFLYFGFLFVIQYIFSFRSPGAGGSYLGDVNVSAILDSFSVSYDKRVRPNYGGESLCTVKLFLRFCFVFLLLACAFARSDFSTIESDLKNGLKCFLIIVEVFVKNEI